MSNKEFNSYRTLVFANHCNILLNHHLNPWAKNQLSKKKAPLEKNNDKYIVFIDSRENLLRFSVLNSLLMCRLKMKVIIYTLPSKLNSFTKLLEDLKDWVTIIPLGTLTHIDEEEYNDLLTSPEFWESIPARKILIMHTDGLIIEPFEFSFFHYDYIGAPWCANKHFSTQVRNFSNDLNEEFYPIWETNKIFDIGFSLAFGNGGVSIRNTEIMKLICNNEIRSKNQNEDIFFCQHLRKYSSKVPSLSMARKFACETHYSESITAHATYKYLSGAEQANIYERHFCNLLGLIKASSKS